MGGLNGKTLTSNGISSIILVSPILGFSQSMGLSPAWGLGIAVTVSNGASLSYTVELTTDPSPNADGYWNSHDSLVNQTTSQNGNIGFPITGLRLVVTGYISGSAHLGCCTWP